MDFRRWREHEKEHQRLNVMERLLMAKQSECLAKIATDSNHDNALRVFLDSACIQIIGAQVGPWF